MVTPAAFMAQMVVASAPVLGFTRKMGQPFLAARGEAPSASGKLPPVAPKHVCYRDACNARAAGHQLRMPRTERTDGPHSAPEDAPMTRDVKSRAYGGVREAW